MPTPPQHAPHLALRAQAYVHVVGLGLGAWMLHARQATDQVSLVSWDLWYQGSAITKVLPPTVFTKYKNTKPRIIKFIFPFCKVSC